MGLFTLNILDKNGKPTWELWALIITIAAMMAMIGCVLYTSKVQQDAYNAYVGEPNSSFLYNNNTLRTVILGCAVAHDKEDHEKFGGINSHWPYTPDMIYDDMEACFVKTGISHFYVKDNGRPTDDVVRVVFSTCTGPHIKDDWYTYSAKIIDVARCMVDSGISFKMN